MVGDSHLARVRGHRLGALEAALGCPVVNLAVGGANVRDVAAQLDGAPADVDRVLLSVGTNDAAPWKQVPLPEFTVLFAALVALLPGRLLYVASPGVVESRTAPGDRTLAGLAAYTEVARAAVARVGGQTLETPRLLGGLGDAAFEDDGLHLSEPAYDLLLGALSLSRPR